LLELISSGNRQSLIVRAFGAPYKVKDQLKQKGYRWQPAKNEQVAHWWKEIDEALQTQENEFLNATYQGASKNTVFEQRNAFNRFKS